ncbi:MULTISPECIES: hypothetical protein [Salinibaculum]|uniref:hypothetical protein n=1 Tax=Salinibaculum TaxID=2732368 RepID=UPI0030CDA6FE
MSAARKAGLVVVALLLVTSVGAANVVMTTERTVLNANFVDQSLAEEDGYNELRDITVDAVTTEVERAAPGQSEQLPAAIQDSIDATALVEETVTAEYVRNQSRANLFRLYEFLHGQRSDLVLRIDMVPLKEGLADAVGDQVRDVSVADLVDQYAPSTGDVPIEITGDRISRMRSSQSGYQDVRDQFRSDVREAVLDRLVDEAFQQASNDELLMLIGEDPRQYTDAEKEQIVTQQEDQIRQALRQRILEEEDGRLSREIDEELADRAETAKQRVREETRQATQDFSENVTGAAIDLQVAVIDGLATDTSYQEFSSRMDAAESRLADEAARLAAQQIDEQVPDAISAGEELAPQDRQQLDRLASNVQLLDTANLVLPVLALVLIGLLYLISRSLETTALTTGVALGVVGLLSFVGASLATGPTETFIRDQVNGEDVQAIQDVAVGFAGKILGTLSAQSLLLLVVGVLLVGVAIASRQGYLDSQRS